MKKCNVIFPGKFKPVHSGHIGMIFKYLESEKYDVRLTVVISRIPKDGLTPETSKKFLDKVFIKYPNVHVNISENNSPVMDVYNMTSQKVYGNGIYVMAASAKGKDMRRTEDYIKVFAKDGKYYTPGVEVISFPVDTDPVHYAERKDAYSNAEISSTILRNDIRKDDYDNFRTGYTQLLESGLIRERDLKEYFNDLKSEILPAEDKSPKYRLAESYQEKTGYPLFEGGAAGHIQHPYEVNEFTFGDLKELVTDLFHGKITGMSEKLDGQNLFASVDEYGNTIFARNNKHLTQEPWCMKDIENNPKWIDYPNVQHAFTNAAITVDKVFKNLDDPVRFFNTGTDARKWVDLEIIDTQNFNVIPYEKSMVSFHNIKLVTTVMGKQIPLISDDPDNGEDLKKLNDAIYKTSRIPFEAQITKELGMSRSVIDNSGKYIKELDKIEKIYGLNDDSTILEYKKLALKQYIHRQHLPFINSMDNDFLDKLIDRWVGDGKRKTLRGIHSEYDKPLDPISFDYLINFDKNEMPKVMYRIMAPLDDLFIRLGNDIISRVSGLINSNKDEVISKLKTNLDIVTNRVREYGDEKSRRKLEKSLQRLSADGMKITQSEGVVFKYKGHLIKLTGAFAPLNQILGLQNV